VPGVVTIVGIADATSVYQKVKWFSTARARVGWANDGAMIYVHRRRRLDGYRAIIHVADHSTYWPCLTRP